MKTLESQKRGILILLIALSFFVNLTAQTSKPLTPEQQQLVTVKNQISQAFQNFDEDGKKLRLTDDSLLQIELGEILWNFEKTESLERYKKAVEKFSKAKSDFISEGENSKYGFEELFAVSAKILKTVSGKSVELEKKLIDEMLDLADRRKNPSADDSNIVADALSQAALSYIGSDVKKSYELAIKSTDFGDGTHLITYLFALSKKEPQTAQKFLDFYFTVVASRNPAKSYRAIGTLGYMIFPSVMINAAMIGNEEILTNGRRVRFLKLLSALAQNREANACNYSAFIYKLKSKYEELLPAEIPFLKLSLQNCESKSIYEGTDGNALETIEDFLAEAEKTTEPEKKENYKMRAAILAQGKRLFGQCIEILDSINVSGDNRELWQITRGDCAVHLSLIYFRENDTGRALKELNAVPKELRLENKIRFIDFVTDEKYEKNALYEILFDAVKENEKFIFENENSKGYGLQLVFPFVAMAEKSKEFPSEAIAQFQQTVKRWNKVYFYEKNDSITIAEPWVIEFRVEPFKLSPYLLKSDYLTTANSIEEINSPLDRVRGRLPLVKFLLNKKSDLEKIIAVKKPETKKS